MPGEAEIDGVAVTSLLVHEDHRGSFTETFRQSWIRSSDPFVQANVAASRPNVLRGLHLHLRQSDYWHLLSGSAFIALVDLRDGSPTFLSTMELSLNAASDPIGILIPPGVAHGYYARTDVLLSYHVDRYFSGDDELGVMWDDRELGVNWPGRDPILSERDSTNPSLSQLLASLSRHDA
jgi:dTDP-4-dehydrorhamnose 3,5-epimerase